MKLQLKYKFKFTINPFSYLKHVFWNSLHTMSDEFSCFPYFNFNCNFFLVYNNDRSDTLAENKTFLRLLLETVCFVLSVIFYHCLLFCWKVILQFLFQLLSSYFLPELGLKYILITHLKSETVFNVVCLSRFRHFCLFLTSPFYDNLQFFFCMDLTSSLSLVFCRKICVVHGLSSSCCIVMAIISNSIISIFNATCISLLHTLSTNVQDVYV